MVGLIIAALVFAWKALIQKSASMESAFISSAQFLWVWCWISAVVASLATALLTMGVTAMASYLGYILGRKGGALGGAVAGGTVSAVSFLSLFLRHGCALTGVYLLKTAGTAEMPFSSFSTPNLVVGGILLLVSLTWKVVARFSSRNSSSAS